MSNAISSNVVPFENAARILEKVVVEGDLSKLSSAERLMYYRAVCESVGLNPLTRPFEYIYLKTQDGMKLVLYAKKDATDQLRQIHSISVSIVSREKVGDVYIVIARARTKDGREDEAIGAVSLTKKEMIWDPKKERHIPTGKIIPLSGEDLANAIMRAETKAKRRVTLSICGLGMLDESELDTIQDSIRYFREEEPANTSMVSIENRQKVLPQGEGEQSQQGGSQKEQPEEQSASSREYTLQKIKNGESKSGEPYMKIFVNELRLPILVKGEGLEEAKRIVGGEGSKIVVETYEENGFTFLKRVVDGGQPSTAAPSETADSAGEKQSDEGEVTAEKKYVFHMSEQGRTGKGTPFVRFISVDTTTGEQLTVIARGEEGIKMFETIPKDGTPFGMEVYEENKFLFLKKVVV